ncbi:MAG TPA: glucose 1-dehydrogenase [Dongiaceae bacterium]|nr:glucose 1-dehydrogenase [Dongiaceae bacterium]
MQALTVQPGQAQSLALISIDPPAPHPGKLLVRCLQIGICGTDSDIVAGHYGEAPAGQDRLVIGHECLGEVLQAGPDSGFRRGDLVVGFVRRPDPVPCENCAAGEWDMCRNGRYTERGIKAADGYAAERFLLSPDFAIKLVPALHHVGVLLEPTSIVAKAWDHIFKIGGRSNWRPRHALITGAGPVGLLAALLGRQRGFDIHVFDRNTDGPKPELVRALGATYHSGDLSTLALRPDIIIECTGAAPVIIDSFTRLAPNGILCLAGLSSGRHDVDLDLAALGTRLVLENDLVFGSVNANRRHYEQAAKALEQAPIAWLERLITRRVALSRWREAFERRPGDIKTVIDFAVDEAHGPAH